MIVGTRRLMLAAALLPGMVGTVALAVPAQQAQAAVHCTGLGSVTACTFTSSQSWTVPSGIHTIAINAIGAAGGEGADSATGLGGDGGLGADSYRTVHVTPGQTLTVIVGRAGEDGALGGDGGSGYGDGGHGGFAGVNGGGGGGSSAVLNSVPLAVGPGGGGGGGAGSCPGTGDGGAGQSSGQDGSGCSMGIAGGSGGIAGGSGSADGTSGEGAAVDTGAGGGGGGGDNGGSGGGAGGDVGAQGGGGGGGTTGIGMIIGYGDPGADGLVIITMDHGVPPEIVTGSTLPHATVNRFYSTTLEATGGSGPYTWSRISGSLPPGLSLSSNGVISGVPASNGTRTFTVQVRDSHGATASKTFSLTVGGAAGDLAVLLTHDRFLRHNRIAYYEIDVANTGDLATSVMTRVTLQLPGSIWVRQGGVGTFWQCHKSSHSTFCSRNATIHAHTNTTIQVKVMVRAARGTIIKARATVRPSDLSPADNTSVDFARVRRS